MELTPLVTAAILAYTAVAAPVAVSSGGEERGANAGESAAGLQPIQISVAANGVISPVSNSIGLKPTSLAFNYHSDDLENMPHITEAHVDPSGLVHDHSHDVRTPSPLSIVKSSDVTKAVEKEAEPIDKQAEEAWVQELQINHPDLKLTDDDLNWIAKPYLQLASCVTAEEFCKTIEDEVKIDKFRYESRNLNEKCTKLHGEYRKQYEAEKAAEEAEMAEEDAQNESQAAKREDSSDQDNIGLLACKAWSHYQILGIKEGGKSFHPLQVKNVCDEWKAKQLVSYERYSKSAININISTIEPRLYTPSLPHLLKVSSIEADTSNQILHSGEKGFTHTKIRDVLASLSPYRRHLVMIQRNNASKNPNLDRTHLYALFGISQDSPEQDKKELAQWLKVETLKFPKHDTAAGRVNGSALDKRINMSNTTQENVPIGPPLRPARAPIQERRTVPGEVQGFEDEPFGTSSNRPMSHLEARKDTHPHSISELSLQSNETNPRHIQGDQKFEMVLDCECDTLNDWQRMIENRPICWPAVRLIQNPAALDMFEIMEYFKGDDGKDTRVYCERVTWLNDWFLSRKQRNCKVVHTYPLHWNGPIAQGEQSDENDRSLLSTYGFKIPWNLRKNTA